MRAPGTDGLCIEKECHDISVINRFTTAAVVALAELHRSLHPGLKLLSTAGDAASISTLGPLVHLWIVDIDVWTAPGVGSLLSHLRRTASAEVLVYSKRAFFRIPMRILANPASSPPDNAIPIVDLASLRTRTYPWQIWRTNYLPETRHAGLQGSLSWYADAG